MIGIFKLARAKKGDDDPTQATSAAAKFGTTGIVLKSTPGRLYLLHVMNVSATPYWVMLFDKASAPVNGDTPVVRRRLAASSEVVIDLSEFGWAFPNAGIGLAISSTDGTLTLAVALDAHFQAQLK